MGRELNPRFYGIDMKIVCELRTGLIGWLLLNLSACAVGYKRTGSISPSLVFVTAAQGVYVADLLWFEVGILSIVGQFFLTGSSDVVSVDNGDGQRRIWLHVNVR